jgi:hypothetical protein
MLLQRFNKVAERGRRKIAADGMKICRCNRRDAWLILMGREYDARKERDNTRPVGYGSDGGSKKACVRPQFQKCGGRRFCQLRRIPH